MNTMLLLHLMLAVLTELNNQGVEANGCGGVSGVYVCHPTNPTRFAICIGEHKYTMTCPGGLFFNARTQVCDWPHHAQCGLTTSSSSSPSHDSSYLQLEKVKLADYHALRQSSYSGTGNNHYGDVNLGNSDYGDVNSGNYHGDVNSGNYNFGDVSAGIVTIRKPGVNQFKDSDGGSGGGGAEGQPHLSDMSYTPLPSPVDYIQPSQDTHITNRYRPGNKAQDDTSTHREHNTHPYTRKSEDATHSHHPHVYKGSRPHPHQQQQQTQKRQEHIQRHSQHTQRRQQIRGRSDEKADDGYNRHVDNAARQRKLRHSTTPQWRTQKDDHDSNHKIGNINSINNHNKGDQDDNHNIDNNSIVDNNQDHKSDSIKTSSHYGHAHAVVGADTFSMHARNKRQGNQDNQDKQDKKDNQENSDRFRLARQPWWISALSKPDTPTQSDGISHTSERARSHASGSRASGSRASRLRAGLLPSFLPAARPSDAATSTQGASPHQPAHHNTSSRQPTRHMTSSRHRTSPGEAWSGAKSINAAAASGPKRRKNARKTGRCSSDTCKLPECRCAGTDIPGNLPADHTPQMILLTFDDSVNEANYDYYSRLFQKQVTNPNGCPVKATFFVSGDATQYRMVEKLYRAGHEIASHSLSHRSPTTYWAHAGYDGYLHEIEGMRTRLEVKGHVPRQHVQGMRVPFLQVGGDAQYQMLHDLGYTYDSSMVTGRLYRNTDPPLWPFTLDYPPTSKVCSLTPCPTRSYPGLWEVPLVRWYGANKLACAMPDACNTGHGKKGILQYLHDNFQRHYNSNRAPLGIFLHATWFGRKAGSVEGLLEFLGNVTERGDVWVLTMSQMLTWMSHPTPVNMTHSITAWGCNL